MANTTVNAATHGTIIVGAGATGLSVARHLRATGQAFCVADNRESPPGLSELNDIDPGADVHLGDYDAALFTGAARLVVSPGVSVDEPAIHQARANGVEVLGDIELFARRARAPVVAITGSNGKSTVTSLVADMAVRAGVNAHAGGNLGPPALDLLALDAPDFYVLELSSFQLETTWSLRAHCAVVLNISDDHMDRYANVSQYAAAKARIYAGADSKVVNRDDPRAASMTADATFSFGLNVPIANHYGLLDVDAQPWLVRGRAPLIAETALALPGRHNTANVLAAVAIAQTMDLPWRAVEATLREYPGLPHRTQRVAMHAGVTWYNDSKATNVGATQAALQGLPGEVVLIAGGIGKGADFSKLSAAVHAKVRALVLIGRDAAVLEEALHTAAPVHHAADMSMAVRTAAALARSGDCVLLSPACASFDMFDNYEARGAAFIAAVNEVLGT